MDVVTPDAINIAEAFAAEMAKCGHPGLRAVGEDVRLRHPIVGVDCWLLRPGGFSLPVMAAMVAERIAADVSVARAVFVPASQHNRAYLRLDVADGVA